MKVPNSGRFRPLVIGPLAVSAVRVSPVAVRRPLPDWLARQIDLLWIREGGAGNKGLFDGRLAGLAGWHQEGKTLELELIPVRYRELWYVHRLAGRQRVPAPDLLPRALGVSAVVVRGDEILLMRRSERVGEWPGKLDVFGGHIDWPEGEVPVGPAEATQEELKEELGEAGQVAVLQSCLGLAEVVRTQKPEIVFLAHIAGDVSLSLAGANDEVEQVVRWPLIHFEDLLERQRDDLTPSAEASLWLFASTRREVTR